MTKIINNRKNSNKNNIYFHKIKKTGNYIQKMEAVTKTNKPSNEMKETQVEELIAKIKEHQMIKDIENGIINGNITTGIGHAVGYTRVSTKMQVEKNSLEAQENMIKNYCEAKKLILDHTYTEPGLSGGDTNRPDLNKMLKAIVPGMKIVVASLDRLSRDMIHVLTMKNKIHERKASIYIIDRGLDTIDPVGETIFSLLASFAEIEKKNTSARISAVMQDMSKQGKLRTKPRFGYKVVNHETIEDENEQMIISLMRCYLKEEPEISLSALARKMALQGIKIRKNKQIYSSTLKNIIEANDLRPK